MGWEAPLNRFLILHLWFTEKLTRPGVVSFGPKPGAPVARLSQSAPVLMRVH